MEVVFWPMLGARILQGYQSVPAKKNAGPRKARLGQMLPSGHSSTHMFESHLWKVKLAFRTCPLSIGSSTNPSNLH